MKKYLLLLSTLCFAPYAFAATTATDNLVSVERIAGPDAKVMKAGSSVKTALKLGAVLKENDTVFTGTNTSMILRLGDGSCVNIGYGTQFTVLPQPSSSVWQDTFQVIVGWVRFLVRAQDTGNFKMKVNTAAGTIGVRGTEFSVDVPSATANSMQVHVLKGTVFVGGSSSDSSLTTQVATNQSVTMTSGTSSPATPFSPNAFINSSKAKGYMKMSLPPTPQERADTKKKQEANLKLTTAARNCNSSMVSQALSEGADINAQDENGKTPLMLAIARNLSTCNSIATSLLSNALISVNIQDFDGMTALMYAAKLGNYAMVESLHTVNADTNLISREEKTAVDYAAANPTISTRIRSHGGRSCSEIRTSSTSSPTTPSPTPQPTSWRVAGRRQAPNHGTPPGINYCGTESPGACETSQRGQYCYVNNGYYWDAGCGCNWFFVYNCM